MQATVFLKKNNASDSPISAAALARRSPYPSSSPLSFPTRWRKEPARCHRRSGGHAPVWVESPLTGRSARGSTARPGRPHFRHVAASFLREKTMGRALSAGSPRPHRGGSRCGARPVGSRFPSRRRRRRQAARSTGRRERRPRVLWTQPARRGEDDDHRPNSCAMHG